MTTAWIPQQNAVWARQVFEDLKSRGLDGGAAVSASGISRAALFRKDGTIPFEKHCRLLDQAALMTGDDCYGLRFGTERDPRDIGLLAYIGMSSANLHDALKNITRYSKLGTEGLVSRLIVERDAALFESALVMPQAVAGYDQEMEFVISLMVNACRALTGRNIAPLEVRFRHGRKTEIRTFERILNCPVIFGSDHECIVFKREQLRLPVVTADDRLLEILKGYGDTILAERARHGPDFKHDVESCIVELLPKGEATAKLVAMELGMSERTLSRRLAEIGLTFKTLLAEIRHDLSLKYVAEPGITLKQTAFLLGYSEVSAFSHAFKRWTGHTPARMRQSVLGV